MKTLQILSLATVLFFSANTIGQSKENKAAEYKAVKELKHDFQNLFEDMPFEDTMCGKEESTISICFSVNEDGSLEFHHIIGQNQELVNYSKEIIANKEIVADKSVLNDNLYWIKVVFKYKKF